MGRSEATGPAWRTGRERDAFASPRTAVSDPNPEPNVSATESDAPIPAESHTNPPVNGQSDTPDHWMAISAPMVGTFYRSPKPGEPTFVDVGDVVAVGDTVGLVEVMKLFTELKTEVAGKVARVDADDTALVEFGQPLIWIEPA